MEKVLEGIAEKPGDFDLMEQALIKAFRELIYQPLMDSLGLTNKALKNSREDLVSAIMSNRIVFYRGSFKGKFDSKVSRELRKMGAVFDRRTGTYKILASKLPEDIRTQIDASESTFNRIAHRVSERLNQIFPEDIADAVDFTKFFDSALWKTNQNIKKQLKAISVTPHLTDGEREKISKEYAENMNRYIKDWTKKEIIELRGKIQKSTMSGNRYESMVNTIQKSYGVSQNKAKFLARQETNLMITKYKESRYESVGIREYIWQCVHMPHDKSPDQHTVGNVRYYHAELNGTRQRFDKPPITSHDGRRNNPGEDFNCRCVAKPIVRF